MDQDIERKYCGRHFIKREKFMKHRKSEHPGTVAGCRNYAIGKCDFSAESCWWRHAKEQEKNSENSDCYICNKAFKSRAEMMMHRKKNHPNVVRKCEMFLTNSCRYREGSCWFVHEEITVNTGNVEVDDDISKKKENNQSVFGKTSMKLKPPLKKQKVD